jgi:hypothetical protein
MAIESGFRHHTNVGRVAACALVAARARRMLAWRLRHADRALTGFSISPSGLREEQ